MDELRTPCAHRGGPDIVQSPMPTADGQGDVALNICSQCRRFWLERDGWLLSRREALQVVRSLPIAEGALA